MNARALTNHLVEMLRREHHAMADFILELAAFDQQKLWRELGHTSLFVFLRRELGLSAGAAQYRKTAAELVQRHPEVEDALRSGKLCLSSVIELAKVLTPENVAEVLPRFFGLSSRDAAAVAVSFRPVEHPPGREIVMPIRSTPTARVAGASTVSAPCEPGPHGPAAAIGCNTHGDVPSALPLLDPVRAPEVPLAEAVHAPAPVAPAARAGAGTEPRPSVEPLDAERARLHITVSRRLLAKLEAAKAALSHSHPGASSEEVLEAALDLLLAQRAKRKGLVARPRKAAAAPVNPETIPAAVKREVWTRGGGRCEWPIDSGGVCGSTLRLELDHITPRALGGPSTADNLRIACRVHNLVAARQTFGDEWMDRFTRPAPLRGRGRGGVQSPPTIPGARCRRAPRHVTGF
jgi:hypothetical protein